MKKIIILSLSLLLLLAAGYFLYDRHVAATRVALVNFQAITLGQIARANENPYIKVREVSLDDLHRLSSFDLVLVNGMGLRVIEEQRAVLQRVADRGVPVYTGMATNPANNICNLDSADREIVAAYLAGGRKSDYRNLLEYARVVIDRKRVSTRAAEPPPIRRSTDYIYHVADGEEREFSTVEEYHRFLVERGLWHETGKRVVVTGQMADPTDLIAALEESGLNVYPLSTFRRLEEFLRAIAPDAVINLPHGRLGERVVSFLEERNIPLFAPLTVNSLVDEWEKDPRGMSGGFLSQSVVMPEIDGAIRPFTLFALYRDKDGLHYSRAIPERLATFVETVNAHLSLAGKPNADKRVAIFYFKGPGQNAMTAGGMEVAPSLYNLLRRMKDEGYTVELPADHRALERDIMQQGAVFGNYAAGALDRFMDTGSPALVSRDDYEAWVAADLRPGKYAEAV
ncbi:MAG: cobaltochelatase subunit CobN, partial [Odoribacteraceae bacterium]|nr:cobaltochelatase subunit CobN [Odoribacteraceae bacterium]